MNTLTIETLREAVEGLDIGCDSAELRDALFALDRLSAKVSAAVGAFDAAGLWDDDHATSMTAWLTTHGGVDRQHGGHLVRDAARLRQLPATSDAWVSGTFSGGQVRAVLANLRAHTLGVYAEQEQNMVNVLAPLSVRDTATAMAQWRIRAEALFDGPEPSEPEQFAYLSQTLNSGWRLDANLNAESGGVIDKALSLERDRQHVEGETRPLGAANADALVAICRFYLDNQQTAKGGRHRPHLNVIIDVEHLADHNGARLWDGTPLDAAAAGRLLCDCGIHRVVTAGRSSILDYGTTTRTIPAPLWAALVIRDQHCRFPGCDRPPKWCEGHHLWAWEDGGPTRLDNLALLCSRHHRCHQPGWNLKLQPDATLHLTQPDGSHHTTHPPGTLSYAA